jgi:phage pi2 protein 07
MKTANGKWWGAVFFCCIVLILLCPSDLKPAIDFYHRAEIQKRMMNREIISVVNALAHPEKENLRMLSVKAGGILHRVSLEQVTKFMTDYESLEKIAPKYIKASSLKKIKSPPKSKYIHIKSALKTALINYEVESLMKIHEERLDDRTLINFEVIPASSLGLKFENERFVGFKGTMTVQKIRPTLVSTQMGHRVSRNREKEDSLLAIFQGEMETENISSVLPNFMVRFAMEVALQKVGILFRNYIENLCERSGKAQSG